MICTRSGPWWRARRSILHEWLAEGTRGRAGPLLKTDLYDEASGPHHHAFELSPAVQFLGIDRDWEIASLARRRLVEEQRDAHVVVADVRRLPFAEGSFEAVFSPSTLDHFEDEDDIPRSLDELGRVLRHGGCLLLTLDNRANPEVWLRAHLPRGLVSRLRADRFRLGLTPAPRVVGDWLEAAGFRIRTMSYLLHSVRYPLIRLLRGLERRGWRGPLSLVERLVLSAEWMRQLPTAFLTGHYVGWHAEKTNLED